MREIFGAATENSFSIHTGPLKHSNEAGASVGNFDLQVGRGAGNTYSTRLMAKVCHYCSGTQTSGSA